MRTRFLAPGRLVIASIAGTLQVFLLVGGIRFWSGFLLHEIPETSPWHSVAKGVGMFIVGLSLFWPFYVFGMAKRSFEDDVVTEPEQKPVREPEDLRF